MIVAVLLASLKNTPVPSRHAIARPFGLSRSQVGAVVNAGSRPGLFVRGQGGELRPTAALLAALRTWIAIELAFYVRHTRPLDAGA